MKAHFEMFAAYNDWANRRLFAACATLSDNDRKADAGAFFGSIHGTLSHMLVADRIWMRRFTGDGPNPTDLKEIPFDDFEELTRAREAMDLRISSFAQLQTEETLAEAFTYMPITNPAPVTQALAPALAHFFNHQTHHRGQCHHMLTARGAEAPPLDLLYYQRETA